MMFFASLVLAIGAAYLYEKSEKTHPLVAIACVPVELVSLLLVLIFAPWQLQLFLVILLWGSSHIPWHHLLNHYG
jgi:hypothetical protein